MHQACFPINVRNNLWTYPEIKLKKEMVIPDKLPSYINYSEVDYCIIWPNLKL